LLSIQAVSLVLQSALLFAGATSTRGLVDGETEKVVERVV
jgi:hypothetical protein